MLDIKKVLTVLSKKRPIFHSEADFQHSLAWEIHNMYPDLNIRLEKREEINGKDIYLDIFAFKNKEVYVLELKYKTKKLEIVLSDEEYRLKDQGAWDHGRYDFCKDIERVEKILKKYPHGIGFVVFLTNDAFYWRKPRNSKAADEDFRIHEGRIIKGTLRWKEGISWGSMKGREEPIELNGVYNIRWRNYSDLKVKNGRFRYLLIKIKREGNV